MKNIKFKCTLLFTISLILCCSLFLVNYYAKNLTDEDKLLLFTAFTRSTTVGPIIPIVPNYIK